MLEELKGLLSVTAEKEKLLKFIIDAVERKVLNYIHHEILPKELEYDVKLIVMACYKTFNYSVENESEASVILTKVKRGDTEYDYETINTQVYNLLDSNDFFGYNVSLNVFRKLRW